MRVGQVYSGKTLKEAELDGQDLTITITEVTTDTFKNDGGGEETKIVILSKEAKPFVCNVTNAKTISKLLGTDETEEWVGKQITLFPTETPFGSEMKPCIRVRSKPALKRPAAKTE